MASGLASALTTCTATWIRKTNALEWSWHQWDFLQLLVLALMSVNQCYDKIVRRDTRDEQNSSSFHFHHSLWMSVLRPGSPRTSVMKLEDDEVKSLGYKMSALDGVNVDKLCLAERRMEEKHRF